MTRWLVSATSAAACALLAPTVAGAGVRISETAPVVLLTGVVDMEGQPYDAARWLVSAPGAGAADAKGAILIVFWASWCRPCVSEIPVLNELHRFYGKRGLRVVGLGVREGGETLEGIRKAALAHGVTYPTLFDSQGTGQELFGVGALPTSVLLSGAGVVLWNGPALPEDIMARIAAALGPGGEGGTK